MKPVELVIAAAFLAYLILRRRRISGEGRVLIVVVVAGLAVHGTGLVRLPNLEQLIVDVAESLGHWTYLLVGAMAFAETGAFLGFVAPGEVTVIIGGVVAGQGQINVIALIAVVWSCAVLGDVVSYTIGGRLGREFLVRHGPRVKITEDRLEKVEDFFRRRGGLTIIVGRFIGLVRPIAPFLAGSSKMPFRRFIAFDIVAAGAWSTTFVVLGYVFWHSFDQVTAIAKKGALAFGAAVCLGVGVVWLVRHRVEVRDRVLGTRAGRAVAGPVSFFWNRITPGELGLELTSLLAAVAVGSFAYVGYLIVLQDVATTPGDLRAFDIAAHLHGVFALHLAKAVTWLGAAPVSWTLVLVASGWLAFAGRRLEALVLVAGLVLTIVGVSATQPAMDRPRPEGPLAGSSGASYPSGHAAYAVGWVAVAVALSRAAPTLRRLAVPVVAIVVAAAVALSRVYLRVHYLSDVLGGAGLAVTCFGLCAVTALIVDFVRNNETA
jgi:membrane protein DedA with SNARE-associated domain/membrane-associated phospholipid phosphatase